MSRAEFIPPPRNLHRADDLGLRAGLASFLVHGLLIGLLVAGGLYYKRFPFLLTHTVEPPPMQMNLVPIALPPPEPVPIPPPVPMVPPKPIEPLVKAKPNPTVKKHEPTVAHVHKTPPPAPPIPVVPPIAHAVPTKESPRALPVPPVQIPKIVSPKTPAKVPLKALPVLAPPPPPIAQAVHAKTPPKALPVAMPAPVEKPAPIPVIPVLPAMPPPRAVAVAPPAPKPVPVLPAMPPPRAVAVAPPAPVAEPAPAPPQPEVAPVPTPEPADPGPPSLLAKPDFVLIEGPDKTDFPQPNYPWAARSRGLTGTVLMNVQFDERGRVIFAEVAKSSGVDILDTATRSFILARWHLPMYAGKAVSVPIVYRMETR